MQRQKAKLPKRLTIRINPGLSIITHHLGLFPRVRRTSQLIDLLVYSSIGTSIKSPPLFTSHFTHRPPPPILVFLLSWISPQDGWPLGETNNISSTTTNPVPLNLLPFSAYLRNISVATIISGGKYLPPRSIIAFWNISVSLLIYDLMAVPESSGCVQEQPPSES